MLMSPPPSPSLPSLNATIIPARFIIGHITPEAQEGGPIALLKDDDPIVIDAEKRTISVLVSSVSVSSFFVFLLYRFSTNGIHAAVYLVGTSKIYIVEK